MCKMVGDLLRKGFGGKTQIIGVQQQDLIAAAAVEWNRYEPATFRRQAQEAWLHPHNAHELLGISRSTSFRIVNGTSKVPPIVVKLLGMYERYGVPEES
jgi:hypothetical protein